MTHSLGHISIASRLASLSSNPGSELQRLWSPIYGFRTSQYFCFMGWRLLQLSLLVWHSLVMCKDQPANQHVRLLGTFRTSGPAKTTRNPLQGLLCSRPQAGHLLQCKGRTQILLVLVKGPLQFLSIKSISNQNSSFHLLGGTECEGNLNIQELFINVNRI